MAVRSKRFWKTTIERLDLIQRTTGLSQRLMVDVLTVAWQQLDARRRKQALEASRRDNADATPIAVWDRTAERIDQLADEIVPRPTGVQFVDVLTHAWDLLSAPERQQALQTSLQAEQEHAA